MTAPLAPLGVPFLGDVTGRTHCPALVTDQGVITYGELAHRVGAAVRELGPERRLVLLTLTSDVEAVVRYLACLAAGYPVLLAPDDERVRASLRATYDPDLVVSASGVEEIRLESAHALHPDLALLLSTSGSTGSPKLVRLSHENLQANALSIAESLGIREDDRAITSLPLHYCYGLSLLHSHLARGAALVLTRLSVTEPCFWELFRTAGVTTLAGVPHTFALLDRVGFADLDLPRLRYVTQAGGRLAPADVRRFAELGQRRGWDLVVMYGQTEATARMAYLPTDLAHLRPDAVGVPVPGGSFRLDPVEEGDELVYSGPNVMLGYANEPADLALGRTVAELRTGDLARLAPDGLLEVVGRRSRFLKVFGLRIDLDRVQSGLGAGVACCGDDTRLLVVAERPADPVALRARAAARSGLPASAVQVRLVDVLPRTASGKVDCRSLTSTPEPAPPARTARAALARVLERDVAPTDSFTSLGGDSLSYVEASVALEEVLGDLPDDWHLLPVAELDTRVAPTPRRTRLVETGVLLRAAAILLVVAHHAHAVRLMGGAHLLLGVAGFNFARFLLTGDDRRERLRKVRRACTRIVLPTLGVLAISSAIYDYYDWQNWLLIHDLLEPFGGFKDFWFAEVLVQLVLLSGLLLTVPQLDRLERRMPFAVPTALLGLALLARYDVIPTADGKARFYGPLAIAWLFLWGWAAARATTASHRLLLTAVLLAAVPGFFLGNGQREVVVGSGLLLLLWVKRVRLPRAAVPVVAALATSSLYVYLAHYLVIRQLVDISPAVAMAGSFAVGLAYWQVCTRIGRVVQRR